MTLTTAEKIARMEAAIVKAKANLANACTVCYGYGRVYDDEKREVECTACDGTGREVEPEPEPEVLPPLPKVCPRCAADLVDDNRCGECGWTRLLRADMQQHTMPSLTEMAERVHIANAKWWVDLDTGEPLVRNVGELLMLVVSELAEAMEGHRKNLMDDKLPTRPMFEVELADAVIRLLDIAGGMGVVFEDRDDHFIPSENVAESLLQITIMIVQAYEDHQSTLDFSIWIEHAIHAIERLAESTHVDLYGAYEEKMAYNAIRHDHTAEGRQMAHGKKY